MPQTDIHIAVRRVFEKFGKTIVQNPNFANILLDYQAYPKDPILSSKLKEALKAILDNGYGEKLYAWSCNPSVHWENENTRFISAFLRKTAFDAKIVETVAQALQFGIGLLNEISTSWRDIDVSEDFSGALLKLKNAYVSILIKAIVIDEDKLGLQVAYYSPESTAELLELEEKIKSTYVSLSKQYDDWCYNKKTEYLNKFQQDISARNAVIQNQLKQKNRKRIRVASLSTIAAFLIAFLTIGAVLESSHKVEMQSCKDAIAAGDSLAEIHQYNAALMTYQAAIDKYKPNYAKRHFQKIISRKRIDLLQQIYTECSHSSAVLDVPTPTASNCLIVKRLIDSLPPDSILTDEEINNKEKQISPIKQKLSNGISCNMDNLLDKISNNKGKLSPNDIAQLDTLLLCSPDNYWLNIIRKKAK